MNNRLLSNNAYKLRNVFCVYC